jgi:hypothetical protein
LQRSRPRELAAGIGEGNQRHVELGRRAGIEAPGVTSRAGGGRGERGGEEEEWKQAPENDRLSVTANRAG